MSEDKEWKWKRSKNRNLSVSRMVCPRAPAHESPGVMRIIARQEFKNNLAWLRSCWVKWLVRFGARRNREMVQGELWPGMRTRRGLNGGARGWGGTGRRCCESI